MSRRSHSDVEEAEIDLTPMLDCVFIMLIFFIVTTSFTKESGIEMNRPSGSASKPDPRKMPPKVIAITLKNDDAIVIGGRTVDVRAVGANIARALAANAESPVIIQAEKGSSVQPLVQIVDQAKSSGAKNVSVATIEK